MWLWNTMLIEFCDILLTLSVCNGWIGSNTQEYALRSSDQCFLGYIVFHKWIHASMRQEAIISGYGVISVWCVGMGIIPASVSVFALIFLGDIVIGPSAIWQANWSALANKCVSMCQAEVVVSVGGSHSTLWVRVPQWLNVDQLNVEDWVHGFLSHRSNVGGFFFNMWTPEGAHSLDLSKD